MWATVMGVVYWLTSKKSQESQGMQKSFFEKLVALDLK